jgi:hypothetical protein
MEPNMKRWARLVAVISVFMLGLFSYYVGIFSGFGTGTTTYDALLIFGLTIIGGLGTMVLGYGSVIVFGGIVSLKLVEFVARITRSKHVVEATTAKPMTVRDRITREFLMLMLPLLVFVLAVTLAWDAHNLHSSSTSFLHPIVHALDIFAKPLSAEPVSYSFDLVLVMVVLIALVGIVPSLVLPYFRRFKVTGVNSGPFHTDLLLTFMGFVVGLGAVLTVIGLIYEVLWADKGPYYYHYIFPVMFGLSLNYSIGIFLGRERSENMVQARLDNHIGKRVMRGTVKIVGTPSESKNSESGFTDTNETQE